jgi:hypothetical protein
LRQYWPEDQHLLNHEWEQITYTPVPEQAGSMSARAREVTQQQTAGRQGSPQQVPSVVIQPVVVQPVPAVIEQPVPPKPKWTYHERVMQRFAERRAAEEERNRQNAEMYAAQQVEKQRQRDELIRRSQMQLFPAQVEPVWIRDDAPPAQMPIYPQPMTAVGSPSGYGYSAMTPTIPADPVAELEKRLEYALAGSSEISFYSPFQATLDNGTVTVTGAVGSEEQRQAAERILLTQPGVKKVQNNLNVAE